MDMIDRKVKTDNVTEEEKERKSEIVEKIDRVWEKIKRERNVERGRQRVTERERERERERES